MALRYYISPITGNGTRQSPYQVKTSLMVSLGQAGIPATAANWFQTDAAGQPSSAWGLGAVRATSFTAIDADATVDDVLGGSVPAVVDSAAALNDYLATTQLGAVPNARRNVVFAVFDKYAIPRADFTTATLLWTMVERVFRTIYGGTFDLTPVMTGWYI